jgi:hypothetical protein
MNAPVNLDTLHANIITALAAQYPTCTVDDYPRPGDKIVTPAIFIELDDIQADSPPDMGSEQTPVTLRFNAYVINDYKTGKKRAVRTLAAAVMQFVRGKRWSSPVGQGMPITATPDRFQASTQEYEVMRVEWEHEAILGTDVWIDDGDVPEEVNVSEQDGAHAILYPQD